MVVVLALSAALLQGTDSATGGGAPAAEPLAAVDHVVEHGLAAGGYPGAAVVIGRRDTTLLVRGYGRQDWSPRSAAVDPTRTMFDLASLTKVVATTTAAMLLYDRGQLDLHAPVTRYLPRWRGEEKSDVTVEDLLTHRSGLPAGRELWRVARSPAAARREVLATPLALTPGEHYVYSDLGADVLGFVVEAISHQHLNAYVDRHIYQPLGMRHTRFRPGRADRSHLARTEAPLGRVHDRNAATLGGVAGHAGLFASASDLAVFARLFLNGGIYRGRRIISDSTVERFTTRMAGSRALGWDTCAGGASCGQYMGPWAFGHTGYTGTSLWVDPDRDVFVIVLANWASGTPDHPAGPGAILADVRADVADLAEAAVAEPRDRAIPRDSVTLRSDWARGWSRGYGTRSGS